MVYHVGVQAGPLCENNVLKPGPAPAPPFICRALPHSQVVSHNKEERTLRLKQTVTSLEITQK